MAKQSKMKGNGGEVDNLSARFGFELPLSIKKTLNKQFKMNLNQYRNTHYRSLNTIKSNFAKMFGEMYGENNDDPISKCWLHYGIYFNDNRTTDLMNIGSVIDKFASDCLVKYGYISDDNRTVIKEVVFSDMGVDPNNGRAILRVYEL